MGLLRGQDPATSKDIAIYADPDTHALLIKSVGAGAPGSANTTEVTQLLVKTAVQDLDTAMGMVTASPVANTLLARLKDLLTGIVLAAGSNLIGAISQTKATLAAQTTMQNAVSATANGTTLDVAGYSIAVVEIIGTFVAIVAFEISQDDSTWYAVNATAIGQDSLATTATAAGLYRVSVGGFKSLRSRVTWTSGTSITCKGSATLADAPPKVISISNTPVSPANISGTITTGGTAQVLAAANAIRRGWWLRNNSTGSLWVSDMTTAVQAQPSLEIKAGELYEAPAGGVSANALSIIGATTAQSFTARGW